MYKVKQPTPTTLRVRNTVQGETIEQKTGRIVRLNEPITDGAPLIYTDRKDGVGEAYDIRTDRWEIAVMEVDAAAKGYVAKREQRHKPTEETPGEGGGE